LTRIGSKAFRTAVCAGEKQHTLKHQPEEKGKGKNHLKKKVRSSTRNHQSRGKSTARRIIGLPREFPTE
jgi:hypothetical protein